jgi:hypothetical protein
MKGIRALIKFVSELLEIPPQYLYGIVILNSEEDPVSHMYIGYDKHSQDFYCGLTRVSFKIAEEIYDLERPFFWNLAANNTKLSIVDLFDPRINLLVAGAHLRRLHKQLGDWKKALFVFNTGSLDNIQHSDGDLFVNNVMKHARRWFPEA